MSLIWTFQACSFCYPLDLKKEKNNTFPGAGGLDILSTKALPSHHIENSNAMSCINWTFFSMDGGFGVTFSTSYNGNVSLSVAKTQQWILKYGNSVSIKKRNAHSVLSVATYLLIDIVFQGASISFLKQVSKLTKLRQIRKSGSSKH